MSDSDVGSPYQRVTKLSESEQRIVHAARVLTMASAAEELLAELDAATRLWVLMVAACRAEDELLKRGADVAWIRNQARGLAAIRERCAA